jgi:hypothetical protein
MSKRIISIEPKIIKIITIITITIGIIIIPIILSDPMFLAGINTQIMWSSFSKKVNHLKPDIQMRNLKLDNDGDIAWDPYYGRFEIVYKEKYKVYFEIWGGTISSIEQDKYGSNGFTIVELQDLENNLYYKFNTDNDKKLYDSFSNLYKIKYRDTNLQLSYKTYSLYDFIKNIDLSIEELLEQIHSIESK